MINTENKLVTDVLPKIGGDAFVVLFVIASHLRHGSTAWPGMDRIRKMAKVRNLKGELKPMSERRAYAAINVLIEFKLISRTQRRHPSGDWGLRVFCLTNGFISVYWNITSQELIEDENNPDGLVQYGEAINGEAITAETEDIDKGEVLSNKVEIEQKWLDAGNERYQ